LTTNPKLSLYIKKWNLSESKLIAETATSSLYAVEREEPLVLKIFTEMGAKDELNGGAALRAWAGNGAVHLKDSDEGAVLIERLYGPNLYALSESGHENEATKIFSEIIKKIHSVKTQDLKDIPSLETLFSSLKYYQEYGYSRHLFKKALEVSEQLLASQTKTVLLHGDLHHENVMKRKGGEYVCFDPKAFLGDPAYEIATILKNPRDYPSISQNEATCLRRAADFSKSLGLPIDRILGFAFVHVCLSTLWSIQDGLDSSRYLKNAIFLLKHISS